MKAYGKIDWAFSGGRIPLRSNGKEPDFISHDKIAVLNTSEEDAMVELTVFSEDAPPIGTYQVKVCAGRLRKIRFNDLVDPRPLNLGKNYSCLIQADVPVVVQFSRMSTGQRANAGMSSMAFPVEDKK